MSLPPPMSLKDALAATTLSQRQIADKLQISAPAVNVLINKGRWPAKNAEGVRLRLVSLLMERGKLDSSAALACIPCTTITPMKGKDTAMLMKKQTLLPATKRFFKIQRDPFTEVQSAEDLFLSDNSRYVREAMFDTAKNGGMLAVIGESGSGKSTLREDMLDRIRREDVPVIPIEPYVLGMEENDKMGKTMKALHVAEAILYTVAPALKCQSSPEARFRQVHKVLRESAQAGNKHVLILEEAHCAPYVLLKQMKRFVEIKNGYDRLLGIILMGQTELKNKLSEASAEIREVVQRIEIVDVKPIDDLRGYVSHRLQRAGLAFDTLFAPDALDSLISKHTGPRDHDNKAGMSLLYPLAVGNTLTAAFNLAAAIGETKITGDIIRRA